MPGGSRMGDSMNTSSLDTEISRMSYGELTANLKARTESLRDYKKAMDTALDKISAPESAIVFQAERFSVFMGVSSCAIILRKGCPDHPRYQARRAPSSPCFVCQCIWEAAKKLDETLEADPWILELLLRPPEAKPLPPREG